MRNGKVSVSNNELLWNSFMEFSKTTPLGAFPKADHSLSERYKAKKTNGWTLPWHILTEQKPYCLVIVTIELLELDTYLHWHSYQNLRLFSFSLIHSIHIHLYAYRIWSFTGNTAKKIIFLLNSSLAIFYIAYPLKGLFEVGTLWSLAHPSIRLFFTIT